jgi:hypothetical protein
MMDRRAAVGVALVCALTSTSPEASAQAEVGKADALFNAGRSLLEAGEYADACPKFAESQKLAPGLGVTLYLADCYERLGRTASALAEFRRAALIASERGDKRGTVAQERAANLEGQVPELVIVVTPRARAQGVTVTRDGEPVPSTQWELPTPMDPGDHEVIVSAPSKTTRRLIAKLVARKGPITTTVDGLEDPAESAFLAASMADNRPRSSRDPSRIQKWISFAAGGVGVLGLGAGSVLGALAISKLHKSNDGPCDATDHCTPTGLSLRQDAEHLGNAATGAFIASGVALAAGVVLYVTLPKPRAPGMGIMIHAILSSEEMGVRAESSF